MTESAIFKEKFEEENSNNAPKKDTLKKNKAPERKPNTNLLDNEESKIFEKYNDELRTLIQKTATQNYPRQSIRKKEEGSVELIFTVEINGKISNVIIGEKTDASQRLIKSSLKTLNLISPYKKNIILKKKNTFSIIIVYKLQ